MKLASVLAFPMQHVAMPVGPMQPVFVHAAPIQSVCVPDVTSNLSLYQLVHWLLPLNVWKSQHPTLCNIFFSLLPKRYDLWTDSLIQLSGVLNQYSNLLPPILLQ